MEINEKILKEYECSICLDLLRKPIIQCQKGHNYCNKCYNSIGNSSPICPQCRGEFTRDKTSRNLFIEDMMTKFTTKCTNKGCDKLIRLDRFNTHTEKDCGYTSLTCAFKSYGCKWGGYQKDFKIHEQQCGYRTLRKNNNNNNKISK